MSNLATGMQRTIAENRAKAGTGPFTINPLTGNPNGIDIEWILKQIGGNTGEGDRAQPAPAQQGGVVQYRQEPQRPNVMAPIEQSQQAARGSGRPFDPEMALAYALNGDQRLAEYATKYPEETTAFLMQNLAGQGRATIPRGVSMATLEHISRYLKEQDEQNAANQQRQGGTSLMPGGVVNYR